MDKKVARMLELEKWFSTEYLLRLEHIRRCKYFNIESDETMYSLQKEAYDKEQEYRKLKGKKPLEDISDGIFII